MAQPKAAGVAPRPAPAADTGSGAAVLNRNIKELITAHPAVAAALTRFGIACTDCAMGTCRLRDVVEIHGLPLEQEVALFEQVAAVVCPGQRLALPASTRRVPAGRTPRRLSPPMRRLVEEHTYIKRAIELIPRLTADLADNLERRRPALTALLDFIRGYADTYHHAKEEDILFKFLDPQTEVIQAFANDHDLGRGHVRTAAAALAAGDAATVTLALNAYATLLQEHIRKEDDILYPWMDRTLTDSGVGRLFAQFAEVERRFAGKPAAFEAWVARSEQELNG